jgi:hypothetical protein
MCKKEKALNPGAFFLSKLISEFIQDIRTGESNCL